MKKHTGCNYTAAKTNHSSSQFPPFNFSPCTPRLASQHKSATPALDLFQCQSNPTNKLISPANQSCSLSLEANVEVYILKQDNLHHP